MATIKVSDVNGVKFLSCFDALVNVPYEVVEEEIIDASDDTEASE